MLKSAFPKWGNTAFQSHRAGPLETGVAADFSETDLRLGSPLEAWRGTSRGWVTQGPGSARQQHREARHRPFTRKGGLARLPGAALSGGRRAQPGRCGGRGTRPRSGRRGAGPREEAASREDERGVPGGGVLGSSDGTPRGGGGPHPGKRGQGRCPAERTSREPGPPTGPRPAAPLPTRLLPPSPKENVARPLTGSAAVTPTARPGRPLAPPLPAKDPPPATCPRALQSLARPSPQVSAPRAAPPARRGHFHRSPAYSGGGPASSRPDPGDGGGAKICVLLRTPSRRGRGEVEPPG